MSDQNNTAVKIPSLNKLRAAFSRERQELRDNQFEQFLQILENKENQSRKEAEEAIRRLYESWANSFETLKKEFNSVRNMFSKIESRVKGWYCVSPNLAQWNTVGAGKGGYTFATGIMKNHHRQAPRSEKSLSVSFAFDEKPVGIGDETFLGFPGPVTDSLAGLQACTSRSLKEQGEGMSVIYRQMKDKNLVFRLYHKAVGQQIAKLPISVLEEYSLRELCQGLFLTLNNDVIAELQLNNALDNPRKLVAIGHDKQA